MQGHPPGTAQAHPSLAGGGETRLAGNVLPPSRTESALRWRWLLPVAVVLLGFHFSPLRSAWDRAFFDLASRHPARAIPPPEGSSLVLFDTATMEMLSEQGLGGTWPPPRAAFASVLAGLARAGAARIAMDFVFLDHSASAEQDALLGGLAAGMRNVVLARMPQQGPVFWDEAFRTEHATLFAEPRTGLVDAPADVDGVLRRYVVADSLAAAALARPSTAASRSTSATSPSDANRSGLLRWYGGLQQLRQQGGRVPVISAAPFLVAGLSVASRAVETEADLNPTALAAAVAAEPPLTGPAADAVRGRVVFVGANAAGTFDQKPLAIGGLEPGVLLHWTAWANLVSHGFIAELPPWAAPGLALAFLAALAATSGRPSGLRLPGAIATVLVLGTVGAAYLGHSFGWFLPPATPIAAAGLGLLGVVAENFWTERRRRQEVQTMFGSYVAPEIVDLLVRDPTAIRLGGERREATVFFCDLAGFTDLSEQVSPEELLKLINGYLEQTSECLMTHGAYVDKYIGDAVMAVFGAPNPLPNHALAACRAALAVQRQLAQRNVELAATYGRTLGLRIGLNSGDMIVGNVGSERKRNYTVLGDTVNLSSRLEGANKAFGTRILVGDSTVQRAGDAVVFRPLTALRVKGKQTAVPVFELVGEPAEITAAQRTFLDAYGNAHAAYRSRQFAAAVEGFAQAARLNPDDQMTGKLLAECQRLALDPPPPDWQPILSLDTK